MNSNYFRFGRGKQIWVKAIIVLLIASVFFELYVQNIIVVSGNSMKNTIFDGDRLIIKPLPVTIKSNTLAVFAKGIEHYVKRCIAIPGDTVEIRSGNVYVNHNLVCESTTALKSSKDSSNSSNISLPTFQQYGKFWNNNFFGPLIIPYKGMSLNIDSASFSLYNNSCSYENLKIGKPYVFTHNYYFVMGDNLDGSTDSRNGLGLISFEQMIGIPYRVLFSAHSINRTLKRIK
jgi:signal peptidase I